MGGVVIDMGKIQCFNLGVLVGLGIYALAMKLALKNYQQWRKLLEDRANELRGNIH